MFYEEGGKRVFFPPIGPKPEEVTADVLGLSGPGSVFSRVPEEVASATRESGLVVKEDPDNHDYVYSREDLAGLKGARYYTKRSFAKKAMRHNPVILEDRDIDVDRCRTLQEEWCDLRGCGRNRGLSQEAAAIHSLFLYKKELGVSCVGIEIGGRLAAFAAGEMLNRETFVVHFEKADTTYEGIYQLINREFARRVPSAIQYINREQDLGIEGLRKAKKSYHPVFTVRKFIVSKG